LEFWQLIVLVFLGALLDAPGGTAREAMLPELANMAGMPIERATSAIHIIERSARLVGAPLAGFLIAFTSTANVLWVDAISFIVSAGMIGGDPNTCQTCGRRRRNIDGRQMIEVYQDRPYLPS
jgi:hypothetical protein